MDTNQQQNEQDNQINKKIKLDNSESTTTNTTTSPLSTTTSTTTTNENNEVNLSNSEKKKRNKGRFVFKQYNIHHELCAQKVGTDALLVAGYTSIAKFKPYNLLKENQNSINNQLNELVFGDQDKPYDYEFGNQYDKLLNYDEEYQDNNGNNNNNEKTNDYWPNYILDIGTGSNILSIMLGQRFKKSIINSIDIDESAIKQASINIDTIYKEGKSITDRIYLFHTPIQQFDPLDLQDNENKENDEQEKGIEKKHKYQVRLNKDKETIKTIPEQRFTPSKDGLYDLIISAPPYFPTDPQIDKNVSSMQTNRRIARHTHTLTMEDLVLAVKKLLRPDIGVFTTIVSVPDPSDDLEIAAKNNGLSCLEIVDVTDAPNTKVIRKMYTFKLFSNQNDIDNNQTIKRQLAIYETGIKDSTLRNHRKHSNPYKFMLNDFCDHFLKEANQDNNNNNNNNNNSNNNNNNI